MRASTARAKAGWVGVLAVLAGLVLAACGGSSGGSSSSAAGTTAAAGGATSAAASNEKVDLTFWFWGDADAPGANAAMADAVKAYEAAHPNVTIKVVEQATDTFIATFQAAAAAKNGPDIARAVGHRPGADAGLGRRRHRHLRPRAAGRGGALAEHVGEHVQRQGLGDAAVPDRDPVGLQQDAARRRPASPHRPPRGTRC